MLENSNNILENTQKVAEVASTLSEQVGGKPEIGQAVNTAKTMKELVKEAEEKGKIAEANYKKIQEAATAIKRQPEPKETINQVMASSYVHGVNHLTKLSIVINKKPIKSYKYFNLFQDIATHHHFTLVLDHDALGNPQSHNLEDAQEFLGKRIEIDFEYKGVNSSPLRYFVGVVTHVGFSREYGNKGNIVIKGGSPTLLLDAASHIQSFSESNLETIATNIFNEAFPNKKFDFKIELNFTSNLSYISQYDETHYNFLARIAENYGEQFFYDGQKICFGKIPASEDELHLTFGRDVSEIDIQLKAKHINRKFYGYNSSNDEPLETGTTDITHQSDLAKKAYNLSKETFKTTSLKIAPIKASHAKDVEASQKSAIGSAASEVLVVSGKTSVPFLYPGCRIKMNMRNAENTESEHLTYLLITTIDHSVDTLGNYTGRFEAIASDSGYIPTPVHHIPSAEPQMAKVVDNKDPKNQGRVKVHFPWQTNNKDSDWIRVMSPDAGGSDKVSKNRGFVAIPEIGDQVMIGFVHNHPDRPYVMGGLFHGKIGGGGGSGNNVKSLSSKSGHTVELNDGGGITIKDKTGGNMIVVDGNDTITATSSNIIELTNGKSSIKMEGTKITIYADEIEIAKTGGPSSKIEIKGLETTLSGDDSVKILSNTLAEINSKTKTDIIGTTTLNAKGTTVNISADGIANVKGATVNIN